MQNVIFVAGTNTGAGKTVLTALALTYLRQTGHHAFAIKPFCSGSWGDIRTLRQAQDNELELAEINPFHFDEPVAPLLAARQAGKRVALNQAVTHIATLARRCELLLVEGAGGLLVPLGETYTVASLIAALRCPVLVVARNQLGAVNHTLLTLESLRRLRLPWVRTVLMNGRRQDFATKNNRQLIAEFAHTDQVFEIPFLGPHAKTRAVLRSQANSLHAILADLLRLT